jgi:hypothetical protein
LKPKFQTILDFRFTKSGSFFMILTKLAHLPLFTFFSRQARATDP